MRLGRATTLHNVVMVAPELDTQTDCLRYMVGR
jgi:hypothetical protein